MDEIDKFYDYFHEELQEIPPQPTCNHDWRIVDGFHTCIQCGVVKLSYVSEKSITKYKCNHIYLRPKYFKEKLELIAGYRQCIKEGYNDTVKLLKHDNIQTLHQLKLANEEKEIKQILQIHLFYFLRINWY